jgi:hypothetical protein
VDISSLRRELTRYDNHLELEFDNLSGEWQITNVDNRGERYVWQKIPLGQLDRGMEIVHHLWRNDWRKHPNGEKEFLRRASENEPEWEAARVKAQKEWVKEQTEKIEPLAMKVAGNRVYQNH